ncbi:MAG: DUF6776 family protein [Pseudomonadota bacterium]
MKLVVKQHRPVRRATIILFFLLGATLAVAVAFNYGKWNHILSTLDRSQSKAGLIEENIELKQQVDELESEIARNRRVIDIDKNARIDYQKSVTALETDIANLESELGFYREIFASTEAESGPQVRGFRITDFDGERRYQYRLVLTHVTKDDRVADGNVAVEFRGKKDGKEHWVRLGQIAQDGADPLSFKFKHFRRIEGIMELPEGFLPRDIYVAVHQSGRSKLSFNEVYKWKSVVN